MIWEPGAEKDKKKQNETSEITPDKVMNREHTSSPHNFLFYSSTVACGHYLLIRASFPNVLEIWMIQHFQTDRFTDCSSLLTKMKDRKNTL